MTDSRLVTREDVSDIIVRARNRISGGETLAQMTDAIFDALPATPAVRADADAAWVALRERHQRVTKPTMEPDPAQPGLIRQTAYCQFCASSRPDEDPRWPCETARLIVAALSRSTPTPDATDAAYQRGHDDVMRDVGDALLAKSDATDAGSREAALTPQEEALIRQYAFTNERTSIDGQLWGRPGIKRLFATLDAARALAAPSTPTTEGLDDGDHGMNGSLPANTARLGEQP